MIRLKLINAFTWVLLLIAEMPKSLFACATCFGASDSKLAEGMNWGIMTLLVIVGAVLASIASFFVFLARRAAAVNASHLASETIASTTSKV